MKAIKMITETPFLAVNKELAKKVGLNAAIVFSELASIQNYFLNDGIEEWFFRTGQQIEESTTLSTKVQRKAIAELKKAGILKTKLIGCPATLHFKIDSECIKNLSFQIGQKVTTSCAKMEELDVPKGQTIKKENKRNHSLLELPQSISEELQKAIKEFFQYRVEIGKKFKSDKSINTKINEFISQSEKFGEQAVLESIRASIANGWQGTFIDKKYLTHTTNSKNHGTTNSKTTSKESIADFINKSVQFELD